MDFLIYILIALIVSRTLQVISHLMLYKKWDFKKALEIGYEKKNLWILWVGDLISITSAWYMYKTVQPIEFYVLDGFLLIILMLTFMTDVREHLILNLYTYPTIIVMFVGRLFIQEYVTWVHVSGGIGIALLLGTIMFIMKGKMGGGDLKLFIALGFYFGMFDIIVVMLIASSIGLVYGIIQLRIKKKNEGFAFGPFIVIGTLICMVFDLSLI